MSKQFRDTFIQLFVAGRCCCRSSTTSSMTSNIDNTAAAVIRGDITIPLNAIDTAITLTGGTSSRRLQPGEITSGVVCTVKPRPATVMHWHLLVMMYSLFCRTPCTYVRSFRSLDCYRVWWDFEMLIRYEHLQGINNTLQLECEIGETDRKQNVSLSLWFQTCWHLWLLVCRLICSSIIIWQYSAACPEHVNQGLL